MSEICCKFFHKFQAIEFEVLIMQNSHHERLISSRTYNEKRSRLKQDSKAQDEAYKDFHSEVTDSFKPQGMTEAFHLILGPCVPFMRKEAQRAVL